MFHKTITRFCQPLSPNRLLLRLKVKNQSEKYAYFVCYEEEGTSKIKAMFPTVRSRKHTYWQAEIELNQAGACHYSFQCQTTAGELIETLGPFDYYWLEENIHIIPEWVYDAILYQIFPDRFYNANHANDPVNVANWSDQPTLDNFFGGDLEGIAAKVSYLNSLGINLIWLNPIFAASSNHRYNTRDYLTIDPILGDKESFFNLTETLHQSGIRIILDGVFNHTGTDFFAFQDILANGERSFYKDWYYIHSFPVTISPRPNYVCWWDVPSLPKLNATNPLVKEYLLSTATFWLRVGKIDGWRLDVPNEIEPPFWVEFRQRVKAVNPDAYIVGEIWHDARFWLNRNYFDGVMNYLFRDLIVLCFAKKKISLSKLDFLLGLIRLRYPEANNFGLLNMLGSHDTARIITVFQEHLRVIPGYSGSYEEAVKHLQPALIIQFAYPGIPHIYYGDEIGMTGGADPDCRRTFNWDPSSWNHQLHNLYKRLIYLRTMLQPLRHGYFESLLTDDERKLYIFARRFKDEKVIVIINADNQPLTITLTNELVDFGDASWTEGLTDRQLQIVNHQATLTIEANFGAILYRTR